MTYMCGPSFELAGIAVLNCASFRTWMVSLSLVSLLPPLAACGTPSAQPVPEPTGQRLVQTPAPLTQSTVAPALIAGTTAIPSDSAIAPAPRNPTKQSDCPNLDSALYQLIQAPNPTDSAKGLGFPVKDDKIQVLLVLKGQDVDFLKRFDVEVGSRDGANLQAFVPVSRLCDLANSDQIAAIRKPAMAVPQ